MLVRRSTIATPQAPSPRSPDSARQQARASYKRSCEFGNVEACGSYASMLHFGRGGAKDDDAARPGAKRSCDGNIPAGCAVYAAILIADQDHVGARAAALKGCDANSGGACTTYSYLLWQGWGGPVDKAQALVHAKRGCDLGDVSGCANQDIYKKQ